MITLSLNNDPLEFPENRSLHQALIDWGYLNAAGSDWQQQKCAVAINGEFVPRARYDTVTLKNGDTIDVVSAVGGG